MTKPNPTTRKSPSLRSLFLWMAIAAASATGCATTSHKATTREERASRADELFAEFDLNGDGFLTKDELRGGMRYYAGGGSSLGSDSVMLGLQQGKTKKTSSRRKPTRTLSSEEIERTINEAFSRRDAKLDSRLSKEEFKKVIVERPTASGEADPWEPLL